MNIRKAKLLPHKGSSFGEFRDGLIYCLLQSVRFDTLTLGISCLNDVPIFHEHFHKTVRKVLQKADLLPFFKKKPVHILILLGMRKTNHVHSILLQTAPTLLGAYRKERLRRIGLSYP